VIAYLDASAIVKRYVAEARAAEVGTLLDRAALVATATVSRAEVAAALAKARRLRVLTEADGRKALQRFVREWPHFVRMPVNEALVERASALAWEHDLRGYDAIQLASAMTCRDVIGESVVLATFDRQLWTAATDVGLTPWPASLA